MRASLRQLPAAGRAAAILALAAVGAFSWWWLNAQRDDADLAESPRNPDAYFQNLDVVRHTPDGTPEMRVKAAYAEHFRDEPWIHLREMRAEGLSAGPDWRLRADEGRLTDDGVHLVAHGGVVLERREAGDAGMQLRTESLNVNTDTQTATTDALVTITQGAGQISGRGLEASLAEDRLLLETDVKARYGK